MAGGKKKKDFSVNPFRDLKGFCASGDRDNKAVPVPPPVPTAPATERAGDLFAEEMARLGVKKGCATEAPAAGKEKMDAASLAPEPAEDQALFFATIGKMETTFADELPEPPPVAATPRLRKLLQRGKFVPEAEIDLHGLDRVRARERVRHFLDNSLFQGKKTVRLITGSGHGSDREPVLRNEVESYLLREAGPWVHEWVRAPRRYGGDGAFIVLLRTKKKE